MLKPRSNSDEDLVACAIDCLSLWRRRRDGPDTIEAEAVIASLAAIRSRLAALSATPDGLLAKVDAAIGQDLEDQWNAPAVEPAGRFRKPS
jgi:hypothetical protein